MTNYEELNKRATKDFLEKVKNNKTPNIIFFENEKEDGFMFITSYGTFWFQCEVDEETK